MRNYDVVVVGKGNAALCAALSARDKGAPRLGDTVWPSAGAAPGARVRTIGAICQSAKRYR
jgi:succinate dehydrogenase/fumarate reductase flavoprotein subunit